MIPYRLLSNFTEITDDHHGAVNFHNVTISTFEPLKLVMEPNRQETHAVALEPYELPREPRRPRGSVADP